MDKKYQDQLELFSSSSEESKSSYKEPKASYFSKYIWGYEKSILILIALLIVSIISFSLGVEKGKRLQNPAMEKDTAHLKPVEKTIPQAQEVKEQAVLNLPTKGTYTIQVASFKTTAYAKKEAELLKQRGYQSITLDKGKHVILCVGNVSNKEDAQALLSELRRYYKDCQIRRL